jgi:uncharacterized protein YndB with AHSA1/START domain
VTPADLSTMQVSVQHVFDAAPPEVWALVSDLPAMAAFSPEVAALDWDDAARSRFTATNRREGREWTVSGHVLVRDAPRLLRWTVSDPAHPSSTWEYALTPTAEGGTLVYHRFAHGPGVSLVRRMVEADPARAEAVVAGRSRMLATDMLAGLQAAAASLSPRQAGPPRRPPAT